MGKPSRDKGARGERAVVDLLERTTGTRWRRARGGDAQELGDVIPVDDPGLPWRTAFVEVKTGYKGMHVGHLLKPGKREIDWWAKACEQAWAIHKEPVLFVNLPRWGTACVMDMGSTIAEFDDGMGGRADWWAASVGWGGEEVEVFDASALVPP